MRLVLVLPLKQFRAPISLVRISVIILVAELAYYSSETQMLPSFSLGQAIQFVASDLLSWVLPTWVLLRSLAPLSWVLLSLAPLSLAPLSWVPLSWAPLSSAQI